MTSFRRPLLISLVSLLWTVPALADAIDGDWCAVEGGKTLTIKGPSIRIPSGVEIIGDYDRHAFRYVGPEGDPEAGQEIRMRILSDDDMRLVRVVGGAHQPEEQWLRCKPVA